jgi:hypothetical protein
MSHPAAKGKRFLGAAGDFMSMHGIAKVLKRRMGASARRVPTRQLPISSPKNEFRICGIAI